MADVKKPGSAPKNLAVSRAKEERFIKEANKPFEVARRISVYILVGILVTAVAIHWL